MRLVKEVLVWSIRAFLPNGQQIAVKRLSQSSWLGIQELKNQDNWNGACSGWAWTVGLGTASTMRRLYSYINFIRWNSTLAHHTPKTTPSTMLEARVTTVVFKQIGPVISLVYEVAIFAKNVWETSN